MSEARLRIEAHGRAGELLVRGLFDLVHVELRAGVQIQLVGRSEDGLRATVTIPCEVLEDVPGTASAEDLAPAARKAEARLLEALQP